MNYLSVAKRLGLDKDVKPSTELIRDTSFLGLNPTEVIIKARLGMFITLIGSAISLAFIAGVMGTLLSIIPSLITYYYITEKPKSKAREERLKSLGHAPEIITVLGTSLELNPNLERAVRIAGETCEGRISYDFAKAYKDSILKGVALRDSFKLIINEWGLHSEGFRQGMQLINTSLISKESRAQTINNALNNFFKNLINDLKKFLAKTKTHTLVLFSFGTIIPLILISMLPVVNLLNFESNPLIISLLLGANLLGINYYANYIINNRPASFSQVKIKTSKSFVNKTYAIVLFLVISSPTILYYGAKTLGGVFPIPSNFASMPLILGLAVSISTYYYMNSKDLMKKRSKALKAEKELLNITYNIGTKLQERRSFESVLKKVILEGKNKELNNHLRRAYNNIKDLQKQPEEAVMKELKKTGSKRVSSVFKLIFHALRQGVEQSAQSVLRVYEHFNQMIQAEEEHKALIEQVLSMMKVTALIFAPIISAFIVIMQGMIEANIPNTELPGLSLNFSGGISLELMQLMLGLYTIGLVIVLTKYYVKLRHGPDNVILKHELAKSVMTSTIIYLGVLTTKFILF